MPSSRITPGELGGLDRHRLLASVVLEGGVAVAVEGHGDSPLPDQTLLEHQVAASVLGGVEDGLGHGAGGVVDGDEQRQLMSSVLQPGVLTAVDLHQHPLLGQATTPGRWGVCIMNTVMNDLEQLRGEVERLVYSSEESGFTICRLVVPGRGDLVTVAGTMPGIQPGEHLHLKGRWINHPIHGYQFRA